MLGELLSQVLYAAQKNELATGRTKLHGNLLMFLPSGLYNCGCAEQRFAYLRLGCRLPMSVNSEEMPFHLCLLFVDTICLS